MIRCSQCGATISDDDIDKAIQYSHDCGFDEGYEAAQMECEMFLTSDGFQCGNCGHMHSSEVGMCDYCGADVINIVDER